MATKREINERVTALIIHGFTVAHVIVGAVMGPAAGAVLTPMTIAMVIAIGTQYSANFKIQKAIGVMTNFVGFILGVSIAEFIVGLFPGIGNIANAITTGIVTELLGWATFIVLRDGLDEKKDKMNLFDQIKLLKAAVELRKNNQDLTDKLNAARKSMPEYEREEYDRLMKIITDKDTSREERIDALHRADEILKRYGVSIGVDL